MNSLASADGIPLNEVESDLENTSSGNITPSEAVTPRMVSNLTSKSHKTKTASLLVELKLLSSSQFTKMSNHPLRLNMLLSSQRLLITHHEKIPHNRKLSSLWPKPHLRLRFPYLLRSMTHTPQPQSDYDT